MLHDLKNKTILFLEDNDEFAANTAVLLKVFVTEVYHAGTIAEAENILRSKSIDIIICDIKLKTENGLDFIQTVREKNVEIPIMILSGHKDENFLFRAIPLRICAYLLKPIKYEELMDALKECVKQLHVYQHSTVDLKEGWYYDTEAKILIKEEKRHPLNKKETLFIELIMHNLDRMLTKEMIQIAVWQYDEMSDSALTNFILRIRRRFGKNFIYTIPDLGYRFKL